MSTTKSTRSVQDYPDPDEVFADDSPGDDESQSQTYQCSDPSCDKRSWCDGDHSYSNDPHGKKKLKKKLGIHALESESESVHGVTPPKKRTTDLVGQSPPSPHIIKGEKSPSCSKKIDYGPSLLGEIVENKNDNFESDDVDDVADVEEDVACSQT